jgi:hypothetical protein
VKNISFDVFDSLFQTFTFEKPSDEVNWTKTQITSPDQVKMVVGSRDSRVDCILLWSKPQGKVSISSLQRAVMSWLGSRQLPISESLANAIIAFAVHLSPVCGGPKGFFEELDQLVRLGTAKHVVIVSDATASTSTRCEFSGFKYGTIRAIELSNQLRSFGSEAFALELLGHKEKFALESPDFKRFIIDIPTLCARNKGVIDPGLIYPMGENYFQELSRSHIQLMWNDLEKATLIQNALQGGNLSLWQVATLPGTPRYTSYNGFGVDHNFGWVGKQFFQPGFRMPTPRLLDELLTTLAQSFDIARIESSPLFPLINEIARSISRGWTHAYNGRQDEAFLFMVISLEQVFSDSIATTQTLAKRTAVVCHREHGKSFDDMRRQVVNLYDKRSRIVHDGESPDVDSFFDLQEIATSVLKSLLRFAGRAGTVDDKDKRRVHATWLKLIDFIGSAAEAGQNVRDDTLHECGVEMVPIH